MIERFRVSEERVLVLAPTEKDAQVCHRVLEAAGIETVICESVETLCRDIESGAGAAVLTEETLDRTNFQHLLKSMRRQPAWSDFPLLVLTGEGADSDVALGTLELLGNVTLLERPVRVPALVSAVRSALQARRRQYQIRQQLTDTLRVTRELQNAHRQKDEFLAMLAHELRNPLAPIRNAIEILRDSETAGAAPGDVLDMMERQVSHLVRLVDDLLDVSRILRGKINLRTENIDLASVLGRAVETARPLIDASSHVLTIQLPSPPVRLQGDVVRLAQVFANLLNNAAKYTEPSGHIAITAIRSGDEVIVSVKDDGMGISAQLLPRVFDLFSQAERSLDRSQGGLGLGLTLVRRLVEMHGGGVDVKSDGLGLGSEFVVRLPILAAGEDETVAPVRKENPAVLEEGGPPRRILVIDDNIDAAESLATLLRRCGHQVRTAYDGRSALVEVEGMKPEAVLLDIGLPGMNGYEVARHIRQQPETNGIVLVAVTGYGQEDDRRLSHEAGFDYHLVKPIDPDVVSALISSIRSGERPAGSLSPNSR